ncbi:tail fiber domain-containing protein [Burkholderia ambifaria]|uniref:tail fiber domain-containing protein n=1 Tax=Burkholderia ambifaria TaxID=152480 RepID=UPI001B979E12|nr:tail fiber domain-containing protein [Burkholderia ambifaria]MBR8343083.1 tail fiber domain-containing protein [Burkholderia ambifaria]
MALWQWSTTPANNASAGTIDWAEGQPPSTVNDSARQMMADVAAWYASPEWLNYGDTPTYVSGTQFTVPANLTGRYSVGRRVKATVTAGVVYGSITASVYTSLTTVTVAWDSGSLDSGLTEVDVGMINPAFSSLGLLSNLIISGNAFQVGTGQNSEIDLKLSNANTTGWFFLNTSGATGFWDGTRSFSRWYSDTSGNFTAAGTIRGTDVTGTSDRRLKSHIKKIQNATETVLSWVGVTFQRKGDKTKRRYAGFVADDLLKSAPELVFEDVEGIKSVAYGNACAYLAAAFCELEARVRRMESGK